MTKCKYIFSHLAILIHFYMTDYLDKEDEVFEGRVEVGFLL